MGDGVLERDLGGLELNLTMAIENQLKLLISMGLYIHSINGVSSVQT